MTDKMRQEFETWAKPLGFDMDYIYADDEFKCYCFTATQNAFDMWKSGWQASRAALCVELPDRYIGHPYRNDILSAIDECRIALDDAEVCYK